MTKACKTRRELKPRSKRAVTTYLLLLMVAAILLLLLAYFTQERAFAQTAATVFAAM